MRVFRITRRRFIRDALTGEGARRDGGRWNTRGVPMVYCADSRALAVLEILAHVDPDTAPDDLVLLEIDIPETVAVQSLIASSLPRDWRRSPAPEEIADLGDRWIRGGEAAVLSVPSAIVPAEHCILLNPMHPDFATIKVTGEEPLVLDPRLL